MSKDSKSAKLNQIIQNFYVKAAQVVVQSRIQVNPVYARGSSVPKINKWFNLELDETDAFREDLRLWRNCDVFESTPPPPLVIETYLDGRNLNPHQSLVLIENGKSTNIFKERPTEVVLERWIIEFSQENNSTVDQDLPVVYKKCIILFRALYAHCRLLPCWNLRRKLSRSKLNVSPITVGCRVLNGSLPISSKGRIGLTKPIVDSKDAHLQTFTFGSVSTPVGSLRISVSYRINNDFKVSDSEAILSSQFLHLDERAAYSPPASPIKERKSSVGSKGSIKSLEESPTQQPIKPPVAFMQPFKSPSLSASPSETSINTQTQQQQTKQQQQQQQQQQSNSSLAALRAPSSSGQRSAAKNIPGATEQISTGAVNTTVAAASSSSSRYSSSFGSRSHWPRSGSFSSRSRPQSYVEPSSVGSDTSSVVGPGSGLYIDDDDLGNFVKMVDSARLHKDLSGSSSSEESKNPLAKFQLLRGNHAALSDSLQSSIYVPERTPSQQQQQQQTAPLSSSPLRGANYTPLVPSRLSEEYTADSSKPPTFGVQRRTSKGSIESTTAAAQNPPSPTMAQPLEIPKSSVKKGESVSVSNSKTRDYEEMRPSMAMEVRHQSLPRGTSSTKSDSDNQSRPRSKLSYYNNMSESALDPGDSMEDDDLLFAMSDMHVDSNTAKSNNNPFGPLEWDHEH